MTKTITAVRTPATGRPLPRPTTLTPQQIAAVAGGLKSASGTKGGTMGHWPVDKPA